MSQSDKAFDLAIGLYACDDASMHDANAIKDIVAALEAEVDQQRTRAEAAEAELREAHKLIAAMEATAELVAKHRAEVDAGLQRMRSRFDAAYRTMMRAKVALGTQADREQVAHFINEAVEALATKVTA